MRGERSCWSRSRRSGGERSSRFACWSVRKPLPIAEKGRVKWLNSFRRVENEALWDDLSRQSPSGESTLHLPRRANRPARMVRLPLRFAALTLQPPRGSRLPPVDLWAVHLRAEETDDPEPIAWTLLTTVPLHPFDDAVERAE